MDPREQTKQRHQKKINRNLKGLLSKCYKYGKLSGVELALYVEYEEKDEFIFFESEGYRCDGRIAEKKASGKSKMYKPSDVEEMLNVLHEKKVQKQVRDQRATSVRKRTPSCSRDFARELSDRIAELGQFPKFPDLQVRLFGQTSR